MFVNTSCELPFIQALIKSNGDVLFCSHQTEKIGNLASHNFDEIWFGELADLVRLSLIEESKHLNCCVKTCPVSEFVLKKIEYGEYPAILTIESSEGIELYLPKIQHLVLSISKLILKGSLDFNHILNLLKVKDKIIVEIFVKEKLDVVAWSDIPKSKITFDIDYSSNLTDLYQFGRIRTKEQILVVKHVIKNMNLYESMGIVHIAKDVKADFVEFDCDVESTVENCGSLFKMQQELIACCLELKVAVNFMKPLDDGMFQKLI